MKKQFKFQQKPGIWIDSSIHDSQIVYSLTLIFVAVDEGSYKPDDQLKKVRDAAEETLKIAHSMKIIKTKKEMEDNPQSDDD